MFIDEANLLGLKRQLTEFRRFDPPSIRIKGINYPLTAEHKIIFAGNPNSYRSERQPIDFFEPHDTVEIFHPLPMCVIHEEVIKPMLMTLASDEDIQTISSTIAPIFEWLIQESKKNVLISPRQIQEIIRHILLNAHRGVLITPESVQMLTYKVMAPRLSKELLAAWESFWPLSIQPITETTPTESIDYGPSTKFLVTPSRIKPLQALNDFLAIRSMSRLDDTPTTLAYGGLNCFILEGEPGVGKSKMALAVLLQQGFHEIKKEHINEGTEQMILTNAQTDYFFRISAEDTLETINTILDLAFKTGSVVLVDEINSLPAMEQKLNNYLEGKALNNTSILPLFERGVQGGFDSTTTIRRGSRLIGTQNPATRKGRGIVSPALDNRTHLEVLDPYPHEEMIQILQDSYHILPTDKIERLVTLFEDLVQEQKNDKESKKEPLVFRDLLNAATELEKLERVYAWKGENNLRAPLLTSTHQSLFNAVNSSSFSPQKRKYDPKAKPKKDASTEIDEDLQAAKRKFFGGTLSK